ncbi:MAG: long-chain fatty acid--CoA ligase, partial [Desulfomonilia bacterium]|nr:long-chain fatty acid--CoA ligase [Desulfomonilia bacterium]
IGAFDEEGFLMITDRKKDLIITSGGKNIAPHPLEVSLIARPFIEQAIVIGDQRNYLTALIVPDLKELKTFARRNSLPYETEEDLVCHRIIIDLIQAEVNAVNDTLPRYEQIKYFTLLDRPFTEQDGELTPTLKLKRTMILEKYRERIDQMYRH